MSGRGEPLGSKYLLDEEIGRGGMGIVWRGRERESGAVYAIKVIRPELAGEPKVVARFVQERAALTQVRHHNIVAVHDMIVEGDRLALVMDLVAGSDLVHYRESKGGTLPPGEAAWLASQICDALAAAHATGVVHRDIKPANILVDHADPASPVRLADFGIARITEVTRLTSTDVVIGTASYLSPEIIMGHPPQAAGDVYAVGMTLHELLVARSPFPGGPPAAILHHHLNTAPTRLPGIPDVLWALIETCLAKYPSVRPSAADLAARLRATAPALATLPAQPSIDPAAFPPPLPGPSPAPGPGAFVAGPGAFAAGPGAFAASADALAAPHGPNAFAAAPGAAGTPAKGTASPSAPADANGTSPGTFAPGPGASTLGAGAPSTSNGTGPSAAGPSSFVPGPPAPGAFPAEAGDGVPTAQVYGGAGAGAFTAGAPGYSFAAGPGPGSAGSAQGDAAYRASALTISDAHGQNTLPHPRQGGGRSRTVTIAAIAATVVAVGGVAVGAAIVASHGGGDDRRASGDASSPPAAAAGGPSATTEASQAPSEAAQAQTPGAKSSGTEQPSPSATATTKAAARVGYQSWVCSPIKVFGDKRALTGCIKYDKSQVFLKAVLRGAQPTDSLNIVFKREDQSDVGNWDGTACAGGKACVFTKTLTRPAHGKYTMLPKRLIGGKWVAGRSDGHEPGIIDFWSGV